MVANLKIFKDFWNGKKVFLTGYTGFKGSWLSIWLLDLGANLVGYSLPPPTKPSLFETSGVAKKMTGIQEDILNFEKLKSEISKHKPEIIIHMAAQSLVHVSYTNPRDTYATNVMGTVNLLEAIRQIGEVKVVLNVTSDKCYENKEQETEYKEEDTLGGYDPYSNSKACAEFVTDSYRNSFFNPNDFSRHGVALASARAGNVIGGGDWSSDRLIPDIVRAIFNSSRLKIRNPKAKRPWQHVLEPLSGYLLLAQKLWEDGTKYSEAWNFGPNDRDVKEVLWIFKRFHDLWGEGIDFEQPAGERIHETQCLKLDSSKAKARLSWYPVWDINKALEMTALWYKALRDKKDMSKFTLSQIKEYEEELVKVNKNLLNV